MSSFSTKKSLGQHFLTSPIVPNWMCDAADLQPGDSVIEIGPGTGVLTRALLERGATVLALEADTRAIAVLEADFATDIASKKLTILHTDVRELAIPDLPITQKPYKVVANIPYYLTGMLFRLFLTASHQPTSLVFLIQKEVAKRICINQIQGDKASLLSLSVAIFGTPTYIRTVSRGHFQPPPKVDSAIIAVHDIGRHKLGGVQEADFFTLLHLGFGQKRKQLLGNLASTYPREQLVATFTTLSLPLTIRAEDLTIAQWIQLTSALTSPPKG
jgi:16S rRNA (adenine1518-N6/adenine1519-N6)-dimethyltransferase